MARSLKSKRRRRNKQVLRERYKPKYDAQLQSIVANMQKETDELMETAGDVDLEGHVQIIDPDNPDQMEEDSTEKKDSTETKKVNKLHKVDMTKVAKFLSQRKNRKYREKVKAKKQAVKKKVKSGGIQKKSKPAIKW